MIYVACQVLCLGEAILFCENCEAAITKNNLEKFLKSLENQLESYTQVLDHIHILMLLVVEPLQEEVMDKVCSLGGAGGGS